MAKKNTPAGEPRLELVKATPGSMVNPLMAMFTPANPALVPKGAVKLTLPPLLKCDQIPVGSQLAGEIVALVNSVSGKESLKNSKLIHIKHESGREFLLPLTGVIKKAVGGEKGISDRVGDTLIVIRREDGETREYSKADEPAKKMFMFEVYIVPAGK